MPAEFDPYHKWLGIPPGARPPDHYLLLGLARDERDPEVIRNAAARQGGFIRKYQISNEELCADIAEKIALAERTLLDPVRRAAYRRSLGLEESVDGTLPRGAVVAGEN